MYCVTRVANLESNPDLLGGVSYIVFVALLAHRSHAECKGQREAKRRRGAAGYLDWSIILTLFCAYSVPIEIPHNSGLGDARCLRLLVEMRHNIPRRPPNVELTRCRQRTCANRRGGWPDPIRLHGYYHVPNTDKSQFPTTDVGLTAISQASYDTAKSSQPRFTRI